jgi:hypothetical protein
MYGENLMETAILDEIARSGIQAPSADNSLHFWFEYQDAAILIWSDDEFAATTQKHKRVLGLLAFGASVENMLLRAREIGFEGKLTWFPSGRPRLVARMEFQAQSLLQPDMLAKAIATRQTNRQVFFKGTLTEAQRALLATEAAQIEGLTLQWLEGRARKRALQLIWLAESERFLSRSLHQELFSSIRFDLNWRDNAEHGLPPAALEVEPVMRPMFKALRHWPLMRFLNHLGMHRVLGLRAGYLPCRQAPALAVLTTTLALEPGALAVGRGFERVWLRATLEQLVLQPLAAAVVLPLQSDADHGISRVAREKLSHGWGEICHGATPLMVFRMGCREGTAAATLKTGRRDLSSYMLPNSERG